MPDKPSLTTDLAHDVLRTERSDLDVFFAPKNIAVIGATETEHSVGRTVLTNLIKNPFGGTVYPVNPKRPSILGIKAYPSVAAVPDKVDLVVIATPAGSVPGIIGECVDAGVRGAIVISAGFKEAGPEGVELERQVLEKARAGRMRIIGPNCLGVMSPLTGVNATFAQGMAMPGKVAFISQSGALLTAVLDVALREQVGFSAFISLGSMLDVGWADLIDYLGNDPRTDSIVLYMESIGDARAFLSVAREVALTKPIIVIKAGRTEVGAKAAASHTGALTGSDEVLDAAFMRSGVLRVASIAELFLMTEVLAKQPRPRGPRLTIITNAGGPGVLATDSLIQNGGELTEIAPATMETFNGFLPPHWSHGNPIDVLGDAGPDRYAKALAVAADDPNSDGMLVILTPQAMTDATGTAEALRPYAHFAKKPVLASWMGGASVAAGEQILTNAGIPTFDYPDTAARIFNYMWRYSRNLQSLYEVASLPEGGASIAAGQAAEIVEHARSTDRAILTEYESKQVLAAYGIPTVDTYLAATPDDAVRRATEIGYPVVLKLNSETITHKTDVGGVQLNLNDEAAVRAAFQAIEEGVTRAAGEGHFQGVTVQPMAKLDGYELILGSSLDPQFGPVLLFGAGGQLVEVFKDRALALPPLNTTLARRMMERTRINTALKGVRGRPPVDLAALEGLLVRFSQLVAEQRFIKEIDINPLLVSDKRIIALDARVVVHGRDVDEKSIPPLAVRPYPAQYIASAATDDGAPITLRPIRPEDEPLMVAFHETLSEDTVRLRYFHPLALSQRVTHERLIRICMGDFDREMAIVAEQTIDGKKKILGVGRLSRLRGRSEAQFAVLVSDQVQNRGIGTALLRHLLTVARGEGIEEITGSILQENVPMQRLARTVGFELKTETDDPSCLHAVYRVK